MTAITVQYILEGDIGSFLNISIGQGGCLFILVDVSIAIIQYII